MSDRSMPSSFDNDREQTETGWQKVSRKLREEPLIPLGTFLTCMALYNAWRAMRKGDHAQVQRMFRARIGAQAFTVCAIVAGGAYYGADREKRKELIKLEAQKRAEDRHAKWLRELEVRDEEDRQLREHMRRRRERLDEKKMKDGDGDAVAAAVKVTPNGDAQVNKEGGGGGVIGALASAGGWFGVGKKGEDKETPEEKSKEESKPTEQQKPEVDKSKK